MYSIIVCDDDLLFISQLKETIECLFNKHGFRSKITVFSNAKEIGFETLTRCDIAFLDVDFEGQNYTGLDIARRLRSLGSEAVIIFVTNYVEYAPEGYEVQAFRYILKSDISQKLEDVIKQAIIHIQSSKGDIKIQSDGEFINISRRTSDTEGTPRPPVRGNIHASNERHQGAERFSPSKSSLGKLSRNDLSAYNGTPAQPHFTEWGQLGEILGGVKFPECVAKRSLAVRPSPGE